MVDDSGRHHSDRDDKLTSPATPAGSARPSAAPPGLSSASPGRLWTSCSGRRRTSSRLAPSGWKHPAAGPSTGFSFLLNTTRINSSTHMQQRDNTSSARTWWRPEQHDVQRFELQFLSMASVQDLQQGHREGGVLHSQSGSHTHTNSICHAYATTQVGGSISSTPDNDSQSLTTWVGPFHPAGVF